MSPTDASYRLLRHGLLVFLLGLGSGLALLVLPTAFQNLRLALASHLVGVTSGMFLICTGVLAHRVGLSPRHWRRTVWMLIYGAYGNWLGTLLGAFFNTSSLTPVAGAGSSMTSWEEIVVGAMLATSGCATIVACIILFRGLKRE